MDVLTIFALICAVPLMVILYVGAVMVKATVRYLVLNREYANKFPRVPGIMPLLKFFDTEGAMEEVLERKYWFNEDGSVKKIVHLGPYMDGTPLLACSDANDIKEILVEENFPKLPVAYDIIRELLGDGLVSSTGSKWKHRRRSLTPAFHFAQLKHMTATMGQKGEQMVKDLKQKNGAPVDCVKFFGDVTFSVIAATAVGEKYVAPNISHLWVELNEASNQYFLLELLIGKTLTNLIGFPYNVRFNRAKRQIDEAINEAIRKAKLDYDVTEKDDDEEPAGDFLSVLLRSTNEDGSPLTEGEMRAELSTILFAGHDTTSATLSWCCKHLAHHPEIQQKLQQEVDALNGEVPSHASVKNLHYTKSVIMESLRLSPPVPMLERIAKYDCKLGGQDVKAGTYIWPTFVNPMRDERYWEEPQKFNPERWETSSNAKQSHAYSFTPFSAGARNCIGRRFAETEGQILLAILMQHFNVKPVLGKGGKAVFEGTMKPVGLEVIFEPR